MTDSNLNDLHPTLKAIAEAWLADWQKIYPERREPKITITWRSNEEQAALHAADPHGAAPPGKSKHEFMLNGKPASKAFDFEIFDEDGQRITDGTDDWYTDAGKLATDLGAIWGGNFVHAPADYDHIELP